MLGKTILSTKETPEIILDPEGLISIKGRWMKNTGEDFSCPVLEWINSYTADAVDVTVIDICLEYFNGLNANTLIAFLKKIMFVKCQEKCLLINWYYEEGDEDILEFGEYISSVLETRFNFIETSE